MNDTIKPNERELRAAEISKRQQELRHEIEQASYEAHKRAEAAEAKVKELEADKRKVQAEALRWAAKHCHASQEGLLIAADAIERGWVTI